MSLKKECRETMESPMNSIFGRHAEKTLCQLITANHGLFINIFVYFSDHPIPKFKQWILPLRVLYISRNVRSFANTYNELFFPSQSQLRNLFSTVKIWKNIFMYVCTYKKKVTWLTSEEREISVCRFPFAEKSTGSCRVIREFWQ